MNTEHAINAHKKTLEQIEAAINGASTHEDLQHQVMFLAEELWWCFKFRAQNPLWAEQLDQICRQNGSIYNLAGRVGVRIAGDAELT